MSEQKAALPDPVEIAGRYVVERKLGAGAFGTVYKARDKILGRMIAIKTIRLEGLAASGASLAELLKRFLREAQVSAQLKHPNIVTIYDIGEVDGMSYLAMEFIDGVGLEKIIKEGPLPVERAAAIAAQVADALDYAHKNNVVHRDIKPANIMLEAGDRVKVADFGIARVTNSADQLTATGGLLGTPSYMSPEQAKGNELDGRSDLFSVGCVLYEMLTGKRAFRGESITGLIFKVITEDPEPMKQLRSDLPPEIERIVAKAMYKAPAGRYQNGRELVEALHPFVGAGVTPTLRQVETPTESLPELDTPPTAQVEATVATAPTRVTPAPAATPRPSPPPPPSATPRAPAASAAAARETKPQPVKGRQGSAGLLIGLVAVAVIALGGMLWAGWYFFLKKGPETAANQPPATTAPATAPPVSLAESPPPPSLTTPSPEATAEAPPTSLSTPPAASARPEPPGTRRAARGGDSAPPGTQPDVAPPAEPAAPGYPHLDDEEAAAGDEVVRRSGGYRSGGSGVYGGTSYRVRSKIPAGLIPPEKPAVATILHLIAAQEAYHNKFERYASLNELLSARLALLDVKPNGNSFQRRNYRFTLTLEEDGFKVAAQPIGRAGRPFVGDDGGFVRVGLQ